MESTSMKEHTLCTEVTFRSIAPSADVNAQTALIETTGFAVPKGTQHRRRLSVTGARAAVVSRGRSGYQGRSRGSAVTSCSRRPVVSSRASATEEAANLRQSFFVSFKGENLVFDCLTAGTGEVGAGRGGKGAGPRQGARKRLGFESSKRARSSVSEEGFGLHGKRPRILTEVTNRLEKCKCSLPGPRMCVAKEDGSKTPSRPPLVPLALSSWLCRTPLAKPQPAAESCPKCAADLESLGGEGDENTPPLCFSIPARPVPPKRRKRAGHAHSGHASLSHAPCSHAPSVTAFFRAMKNSHGPATDRLKKQCRRRDGDFAGGGGENAVTSTPVKSVDLEKLDAPLTSSPMEIESVRGRLSAVEDPSLSKSDLGITDASSYIECNMSIDFGAISFRNVGNDGAQTRMPQFLEMLPLLDANEPESSVFIPPCNNNLSSADADLEPVASINNNNDDGFVSVSDVHFQPSLPTEQMSDVSSVDVETVEYPARVNTLLPMTESGKVDTISVDHEPLTHDSVERRNSSGSEAALREGGWSKKLALSSMLLRTSSSEVLGGTPTPSPRESGKSSPWTFETALSCLGNNQSPMSVHAHFPEFLRSDMRQTNDSDSPTTFPATRRPPLQKRPSPLTLALNLESPASVPKSKSIQLAFSSSSSSSSTSLSAMPTTKFDFSNLSSDSSSSSPMAQLESSVGMMSFDSPSTLDPRDSESKMAAERNRKSAAKPTSLNLSPLPQATEGEGDPLTPNTLRIQVAVDAFQRQGNVVGDASKTYSLPAVPGDVSSVAYVTPEVVRDLLEGKFVSVIPGFDLLDCRYPYEFSGGHIQGAINVFKREQILAMYEERAGSGCDWQKHVLIFHCEFSSERGPSLCRMLREYDRKRNADRYPHLLFPEIYVLQGGYKEFFEAFPDLCEPRGYTKMWRKEYKDELRHFRAKSHTWPSPKGTQSGRGPLPSFQRPSTAPDPRAQGEPQGCGQHLDVS